MNEIQKFELNVLKDIVEFCKENDIRYYLSSGTLLGAVRHGGFIPWDDDIDMYMPVSDYKKFLKLGAKKLDKKYFIQNYKTENEYSEMWTQIRVNNTTSMPKNLIEWNIHWGLCIDIFPLVGVDEEHLDRQKRHWRLTEFCFLINIQRL